jgi:hypothetical protein
LAVGEAEIPSVVGAYGAIVLDAADGNIVAGVWADAVEHENLGVVEVNRQTVAVDIDTFRGPFRQFVEIAKTGPGHFDTVY